VELTNSFFRRTFGPRKATIPLTYSNVKGWLEKNGVAVSEDTREHPWKDRKDVDVLIISAPTPRQKQKVDRMLKPLETKPSIQISEWEGDSCTITFGL
jgi:hypothetical protein